MAFNETDYNLHMKKLDVTLRLCRENNYQEFLESFQINEFLVLDRQRHLFRKPGAFVGVEPYIFPAVKSFIIIINDISEQASPEQKEVMIPILLTILSVVKDRVEQFKIEPDLSKEFLPTLEEINEALQALPANAPLKNMVEDINNNKSKIELLAIIAQLKTNISTQQNGRETTTNSPEKVNLLTQIEVAITADEDVNANISQHLSEIRNVCLMKRNAWHFWAQPHSVGEFDTLLAASSFTDLEPVVEGLVNNM